MLLGHEGDPLVLAVGSVLSVPLVMLRVGQLSAQRDRVERILAHHARHDELTDLLNRRAMLEEVDRALADLHDGAFDGVALYFCDLDGFKAVNDRLGHRAGDKLLQVVAERLVACVRDVDAVARLGGDEFVVLCPGGPTGPAAGELADRLATAIRAPMTIAGAVVSVDASVGAAVAYRNVPISRDALISAADDSMYRRKREHRALLHG
jgi:diguanylate cyclase (GGDEF)-like protein